VLRKLWLPENEFCESEIRLQQSKNAGGRRAKRQARDGRESTAIAVGAAAPSAMEHRCREKILVLSPPMAWQ